MKIKYKANKDLNRFAIHINDLTSKEVDAVRHMLQSIFRNTKILGSVPVEQLSDQAFVDLSQS